MTATPGEARLGLHQGQAALLVAHGTVDDLDELPEFAARIRRGHPAPPELLAELRRRYEAIGGQSPLNAINRRLASRLEEAVALPVRVANRLARPFVKDVLAELAGMGIERVVALPLAQYSAHVYADAVSEAAAELARAGSRIETECVPSWGEEAGVIEAYAAAIAESLVSIDRSAPTTLVLTAHSLPVAAIRAGDPYEREVRAAAAKVGELVVARAGPRALHREVVFQSQGMSSGPGGRPVEWLGPDLLTAIEACRARGDANVVFAPIGFLADHVEILYDLDIEARRWVEERGMRFHRTRSLNDSDALVKVLARLVGPRLRDPGKAS
jgi:ferrochelatase